MQQMNYRQLVLNDVLKDLLCRAILLYPLVSIQRIQIAATITQSANHTCTLVTLYSYFNEEIWLSYYNEYSVVIEVVNYVDPGRRADCR